MNAIEIRDKRKHSKIIRFQRNTSTANNILCETLTMAKWNDRISYRQLQIQVHEIGCAVSSNLSR